MIFATFLVTIWLMHKSIEAKMFYRIMSDQCAAKNSFIGYCLNDQLMCKYLNLVLKFFSIVFFINSLLAAT